MSHYTQQYMRITTNLVLSYGKRYIETVMKTSLHTSIELLYYCEVEQHNSALTVINNKADNGVSTKFKGTLSST